MKSTLFNKKNKELYSSILISIIVCIVITLLVSSTILYINFEGIALKQVFKSDSNSLMQTSREVSKMTETAKSLSFQIYQDPSIAKLLFYKEPNIFDETLAMRQLDNYRLSMPFIDSIYVYNVKSEDFYISSNNFRNGKQTKSELDDQSILGIFSQIHNNLPYQPIPRTYSIESAIQDTKSTSSYTYLSYDSYSESKFLNATVVLNISESWINPDIGNTISDYKGTTFIINKDGKLFSRNGADSMLTDYSHKTYIKKIIADPSSSYFVDDSKGIKSLITYTAPDSQGWRYVRITPYNDITSAIRMMKIKTILISIIILGLGLFVSVIMSRKLYRPIDKVMSTLKTLQTERRNNQYILRQEFLRNIMLGRESYQPKYLQEKLSYFDSPLVIHRTTMLVLLKVDHYKLCLETYKDGTHLIKYAMMNIGSELSSPFFQVEAIDMGEDSVLLLLNNPVASFDAESDSFIALIEHIQASIQSHLKLSVSITFGPVRESIEECIALYKQLVEASLHRLFRGHGCIIASEDIMRLKSKEYEFPVHKEKQLVDCMMTGKVNESIKIYNDIVNETAEYPYTVVYLAISHLTLTLNNVLNTIKKNNALALQIDLDSTIISMNQVETIEEINVQFITLFEELSAKLDEKRSMKHEELIKKMNDIMERDYSDPNLCINSIADELAMSPIYISRLYKQHTLNAISDVILEVRIRMSKQFLLQSDYSVAEIAEKTGFTSSSYFYRMFKKCNGVTPNDFRKNLPPNPLLS